MTYIAVGDLKKSKELGEKLFQDKELVITRDGKPIALMVGIEPENLESSLSEIRRALFSAAVGRIRDKARDKELPEDLVADMVAESRSQKRLHQ